MTKHKIIITDSLAANGVAVLKESANVDDCTGISPEDLLNTIADYDALIVRSRTKVTPDLLEAASRLKVVGRAGVGVDNIDLEAAKSRGVAVVNSPLATSHAVAEHALGLMLSLARNISKADATMKQGEWAKKQLKGIELQGKTLGVIGVGRIGSAISNLAKSIGMQVMGYDPYLSESELRERGVLPSKMVQPIYDQADFITYHVPLTEDTRNVVNAESFARMKPGVRLICTARGGVINEKDLLEALISGQVAGAALDVFETEPPGLTDLISHPNLVATPHIGAQTVEAQARAGEHIAEEVLNALNGAPLRWRVA